MSARRARESLLRGQQGEEAAARFLAARGCTVLLRNYRCRSGELDIVARDHTGTVLVVEVRLRSRTDFGTAAESVTTHKRLRLLRASRHLLSTRPALGRCPLRFDVIEVTPAADGTRCSLHWIRHAFECH